MGAIEKVSHSYACFPQGTTKPNDDAKCKSTCCICHSLAARASMPLRGRARPSQDLLLARPALLHSPQPRNLDVPSARSNDWGICEARRGGHDLGTQLEDCGADQA